MTRQLHTSEVHFSCSYLQLFTELFHKAFSSLTRIICNDFRLTSHIGNLVYITSNKCHYEHIRLYLFIAV